MPSELQQLNSSFDHKTRVLIVDDSKVIRLALSKILKKDFDVVQAVDGEDGWHKLEEDASISAVFSDVSMPHLDGFGLLDRVRSSADNKIAEIPFIIITANDDDDDFQEKVVSSGGNDLITKPFKTQQILECIEKYITVADTHVESPMVTEPEMVSNAPLIETQAAVNISDVDVADILGLDNSNETPLTEHVSETAIHEEDFSLDEVSDVAFTIDESFLEMSDEIEIEQGSSDSSLLDNESNDELDEMINFEVPDDGDSEFLSLNEEATLSDIRSLDEQSNEEDVSLELDIDFDDIQHAVPVEIDAHEETISLANDAELHLSEQVKVEDNTKCNKKLEIEQARKRAMDIAREQAEHDIENSPEEMARRTSETDEIRKKLGELRQKEQGIGINRNSTKTTSFFKKIMSIISKVFFFRK